MKKFLKSTVAATALMLTCSSCSKAMFSANNACRHMAWYEDQLCLIKTKLLTPIVMSIYDRLDEKHKNFIDDPTHYNYQETAMQTGYPPSVGQTLFELGRIDTFCKSRNPLIIYKENEVMTPEGVRTIRRYYLYICNATTKRIENVAGIIRLLSEQEEDPEKHEEYISNAEGLDDMVKKINSKKINPNCARLMLYSISDMSPEEVGSLFDVNTISAKKVGFAPVCGLIWHPLQENMSVLN